jgi:hypothetical protein
MIGIAAGIFRFISDSYGVILIIPTIILMLFGGIYLIYLHEKDR